ncbi:MAG: 1-acyl-sn-glycerol-3-phosphate acyltransferase [Ruminococcaceae bacterium]|nr:1-acyl-sn-glycerol-3-phosphate acyltransferase [Oscillospiraceae bacterium]
MKLYNFVIKLLKAPIKFLLRVKVIDERTNKDTDSKFIICANHLSNWDPILTIVCTELPINFMAKESLFKVPIIKDVISRFGAFPVSRSGQDLAAIKKSIEIIENGGCFSLFPQGKRLHVEPKPEQAKKGVGFICAKSGAGVLPVGIYTKNYRIRPFRKIIVRIGDIIPAKEIDFGEDGRDFQLASEKIFEKICFLARPDEE